MIYTQNIIDAARSLVDVKYRHGGRSRFSVDCAGMLVVVAEEVGYSHIDVPSYSKFPEGEQLLKILESNLDRTAGPPFTPGRVVAFWIDEGTCHPQHLGLVSEKQTLIHAYAVMKKVVEVPLDQYWRHRLVGSYAWRGVT